MNIHEYQAKQILKQYGVEVPQGVLVLDKSSITAAVDSLKAPAVYVVKAQIHSGGRSRAGGIKLTNCAGQAKEFAGQLLGSHLITDQTGRQGQKVRRIYIEEGASFVKEYYFSCIVDYYNSCITLITSMHGGIDIELVAKHHPDKIVKVKIDPATGLQSFHCREIVWALDLKPPQAQLMIKIVQATYQAFIELDADQIEINPLVLTCQGSLLALDAKISFDDNGLFKHQNIQAMRDINQENPLEARANNVGLNYVKMQGNIGCMVNGAGLAMATMDIIKLYGGQPANFLDIGGSADRAHIAEALRIIIADPAVQGILVNIFGGIMRCDFVAEGIIAAVKNVGLKIPLVVRLMGNNFALGREILASANLEIISADDLADAATKIVTAVDKFRR